MVQKTNDFRGPVYISVANNPPSKDFDPKTGAQACRDFADILKMNSSPSLRAALQYFDAEDHGSVPLLSLYHGLLFIFDGYKPTSSADESLASLNDHFAKISGRLGFEVRPPEEFVNTIGWAKLNYKRETNNAIEFLKANVSNYPNSPNVYASLAEACEIQGEKQLAIQNYKKSLEIYPDNRDAARRLRRLRPFPETAGGPLSDGVYRVTNRRSGKTLEVAGASTANGPVVDQGRYTNGLHQQWVLKNVGDGYYQVTAAHSGKALDVNAFSTRNGACVIQWTTNGGANQIWQAVPNGDGTYRLLNDQSGLALQVANSARTNGAWMEQWQWQAQDQQKWRFYRIPRK
jgi:tetratricopeptide (TPR) repeat protein